jgi:hypothetical protein
MEEDRWEAPGDRGAAGGLVGTILLPLGAGGLGFLEMSRRAGEPVASDEHLQYVVLGLAVAALIGLLLLVRAAAAALRRRRTRRRGIRVEGVITTSKRTLTRVGGDADGHGGDTVYKLRIRGEGPEGPVELRCRSTKGSVGDAVVMRYLPGREHDALMMGLRRARSGDRSTAPVTTV